MTTTNQQAPSVPATPNPAAQLAQALGLGTLLAQAPTVAQHLAAWVAGLATGRRGITVQGAYYAATAVAQALNGGNPVTPGHVAATYLALGGVAPGRGNANGYGAGKQLTLMHSSHYGANKHLTGTGVQHAQGTAQGAPTYTVPAAVLQGVQFAPNVLATLRSAAQAHLTAYGKHPCGCNAKGVAALATIAAGNGSSVQPGTGACGTGRKLGNGTFAVPAPSPAKPANKATTTNKGK
jgi:hypothetical protein